MLDTLPGGQHATRIMPSATEPCTPRISVSTNVSPGSSANCARIATANAFGLDRASLKSSRRVSMAIPNRISPRTIFSVVREPESNAIRMSSTFTR